MLCSHAKCYAVPTMWCPCYAWPVFRHVCRLHDGICLTFLREGCPLVAGSGDPAARFFVFDGFWLRFGSQDAVGEHSPCFAVSLLCVPDLSFELPTPMLAIVFVFRHGVGNCLKPLNDSVVVDYTNSTRRGRWSALLNRWNGRLGWSCVSWWCPGRSTWLQFL